jgi:hypothetical protein
LLLRIQIRNYHAGVRDDGSGGVGHRSYDVGSHQLCMRGEASAKHHCEKKEDLPEPDENVARALAKAGLELRIHKMVHGCRSPDGVLKICEKQMHGSSRHRVDNMQTVKLDRPES